MSVRGRFKTVERRVEPRAQRARLWVLKWALTPRTLIAAVALAALVLGGSRARALPIEVTITATGSGTIGATPFTDAPFTLRLIGDTAARRTFSPEVSDIALTSASIEIAGVGTAQFTGPTRVFGFRGNALYPPAGGFSRAGDAGVDILDVHGAAFATWDMTTDIGPVFDADLSDALPQAVNLGTTLGQLDFTAYANGTFTAHVPEPTAAAGIGALALAAMTARRARRPRPI